MDLNPSSNIIVFTSSNDVSDRFRTSDELFFRTFNLHLFIKSYDSQTAINNTLNKLKENNTFKWIEEFESNLKEYVEVIYDDADLKGYNFVNDLYRRILSAHFASGNETNLIEVTSG